MTTEVTTVTNVKGFEVEHTEYRDSSSDEIVKAFQSRGFLITNINSLFTVMVPQGYPASTLMFVRIRNKEL